MNANSMAGNITAKGIPIDWHDGLPIYAFEPFLKSVADEYGWIGGTDDTGKVRCILPYTVIRKAGIRMVRFRVETIPLEDERLHSSWGATLYRIRLTALRTPLRDTFEVRIELRPEK